MARRGEGVVQAACLAAALSFGAAVVGRSEGLFSSQVPSKGEARPQDGALERRASLLEAAILSKYAATNGAFREIDITDIVSPFVGPGADFHDAEGLLRMAGFSVYVLERRARPPMFMAHWKLPSPLYAILPPSYDVHITLETKVPGQPSPITRVSASMLRSDL